MPQPRVIIPGFRIGTLNDDAFSLVRARLVETSRNYIIANFPNATKRVSLPITGLMTRKRTEPFPTGSSFHLLVFLFSLFLFFPSTPHFFSSARFPMLSPSCRELLFHFVCSFHRPDVLIGWTPGGISVKRGAGAGDTFTRADALHGREVCIGVVLVSKSLIAIVCGFNRKLVLGAWRGERVREGVRSPGYETRTVLW